VKSPRQGILQKTAYKHEDRKLHGAPLRTCSFLLFSSPLFISERDGVIINLEYACISNRSAKDITAEILNHFLRTLPGGFAVDHPFLFPNRVRGCKVGELLGGEIQKLGLKNRGEGFDGHQIVIPGAVPGLSLFIESAAGYQTKWEQRVRSWKISFYGILTILLTVV